MSFQIPQTPAGCSLFPACGSSYVLSTVPTAMPLCLYQGLSPSGKEAQLNAFLCKLPWPRCFVVALGKELRQLLRHSRHAAEQRRGSTKSSVWRRSLAIGWQWEQEQACPRTLGTQLQDTLREKPGVLGQSFLIFLLGLPFPPEKTLHGSGYVGADNRRTGVGRCLGGKITC